MKGKIIVNLKKRLKKFFTLRRHGQEGFTLVELIVVIAIMGILAGVGTVAYSGYITNANKNADKVLVGNIIRAIETGTNSTMFRPDDSLNVGSTTYPIGLVILSAEKGSKVATSTSYVNTVSSAPCVMNETTTVSVLPKNAYSVTPYNNLSKFQQLTAGAMNIILGIFGISSLEESFDVYTIDESKAITIPYCSTHTTLCSKREVYTGVSERSGYYAGQNKKSYYFQEDCTGIYALATAVEGHEPGKVFNKTELVAGGGNRVAVNTDSTLYDAMVAAFGQDLPAMTLKYNGWGKLDEEGHTYASVYGSVDTAVSAVKKTAELLTTGVVGILAKDWLSEDYANAADMADSYTNFVVSNFDESQWIEKWAKAADGAAGYAFGINESQHKDYVYATAKAYNEAFASYCEANGIDTTYANVIRNYATYTSSNAGHAAGRVIPRAVNTKIFDDAIPDAWEGQIKSSKLSKQFQEAGDDDLTEFGKCKLLYKQYVKDEMDKSNAAAIYESFKTVAAIGGDAYKSGAGGSDAYFDYVDNYLQEIAAYYTLIDQYSEKGCIVIFVYMEKGVVTCDVSPSTANPRK